MYQNESIHVIIGFKHDVACTQGPLGYVSALGAMRLVHWLILIAPSCLRSHNARYIMLKSLSNVYFNISQDTPRYIWNLNIWNPSDTSQWIDLFLFHINHLKLTTESQTTCLFVSKVLASENIMHVMSFLSCSVFKTDSGLLFYCYWSVLWHPCVTITGIAKLLCLV